MTTAIILPEEIAQSFKEQSFDAVMTTQGEIFRDVPGRKTIKVQLGGRFYFIKQHFGVGWREVFKTLLSFKKPVISAVTEWDAIHAVANIGIPTTPAVAYGERGINPASRQSFLITEDLGDITSLETLGFAWKKQAPDPRFKRRLIIAVAELARKLHESGMNHRDFYICHICLDNSKLAQGEIYLYLIDLHRVGIRKKISRIDRLKDVAALYFSAMDIGLRHRDFLRFLRAYRAQSLKQIFADEGDFWSQMQQRASKLFLKFHGRLPSAQNLGE